MARAGTDLSADFFRGRYREVLQRSFDSAKARWAAGDTATVIGALSFVGRVGEAELLFEQKKATLGHAQSIEARFYLGVGLTRQSQYAAARRYFGANLRGACATGIEPRSLFFIWQGLSFYRYFSGRLRAASRASGLAFEAAIHGGFLYGKVLSADIRGHLLVQLGEVTEGLATLTEAQKLARLLGDGTLPEVIETSILVYRSQFGLDGDQSLERLQRKARGLAAQDTYSLSNLLLEQARQHLIRGRPDEASTLLDQAAQIIYSTQNRRHEAVLNLRYASLYFLSGEYAQALRFIRSGKRGLDPVVDHLLDLALLGMEAKITGALNLIEAERVTRTAIREKSRNYGGLINRRIARRLEGTPLTATGRKRLDPLGDLLDLINTDRLASIEEILSEGYLGLLYDALKLPHASPHLVLDLEPGSLTMLDRGRVTHSLGLTPLLRKVLGELARNNGSKKGLIEKVWGYRYHPLRHDPTIYSAVTALRKLLGHHGAWIETTEEGYRLAPSVRLVTHSQDTASSPTMAPGTLFDATKDRTSELNYRQIKILRHLDRNETIDLKTCKKQFGVSAITASRDLSALTAKGLVLRIGRGRATQYLKPGKAP